MIVGALFFRVLVEFFWDDFLKQPGGGVFLTFN